MGVIVGSQSKTVIDSTKLGFQGLATKTMHNYHINKDHVPHRDIKILNARNINFEKHDI